MTLFSATNVDAPSAKDALTAAERIFQRWIILHRPLATIMYVLSIVHVVLSYMYAMSFSASE